MSAGEMTRRELLAAVSVGGAAALSAGSAGAATCGCRRRTPCAVSAVERWEFRMGLYVPRIYDNMSSNGYRKYQYQTVRGAFQVTPAQGDEPAIEFLWMENATHRVNGQRVTYETESQDGVLWHGVGSNKTGEFCVRSVVLPLEAMPSYAAGPEPNEDNSLVVTLAGRGTSSGKSLHGAVSGQIGCGCYEYGHVSPTRIWGQDTVVDTAAVYGTWTARKVA